MGSGRDLYMPQVLREVGILLRGQAGTARLNWLRSVDLPAACRDSWDDSESNLGDAAGLAKGETGSAVEDRAGGLLLSAGGSRPAPMGARP
jgi:hypothetical protein